MSPRARLVVWFVVVTAVVLLVTFTPQLADVLARVIPTAWGSHD